MNKNLTLFDEEEDKPEGVIVRKMELETVNGVAHVSLEEDDSCWICRTCGKESEYKKWGDKTPKGWDDCEILGLRCGDCKRKGRMPQ